MPYDYIDVCPGGCCEIGWNCVAGGCCPGTDEACGATQCYSPATETCCPDRGHCPKDKVCVKDGCCNKGLQQCGTLSCYDPLTQVCCGATSLFCEKGYDCVEGGCCLAGHIPCGKTKCWDPKTDVCCSSGGADWTCRSGASCCASGMCYDPETEICCQGGACLKGQTCCGKECCTEFGTCGSDGYCSAKPKSTSILTRSISMLTKSPSISAKSTSIPTLSTPKTSRYSSTTTGCPTPTLTTSQTRTETATFEYNPSRTLVAKAGPSSGASYVDSNAGVLINMCNGIKSYTGKASQGMILTYGGKCFQEQNRKIVCPTVQRKKWCAGGVASYIASVYPTSIYSTIPSSAIAAITQASDMQCDEFPFANTIEGGELPPPVGRGSRACVPAYDQSWQGNVLSRLFNRWKPLVKEGEKYAILITGWDCATQKPVAGPGTKRAADVDWNAGGLTKRDAFSSSITVTGRKLLLWPAAVMLSLLTVSCLIS